MERSALIIRRFDALDLSIRLFSCSDGTVGAEAPGAMNRSGHTNCSLVGYAETAEEAVLSLWQAVEDMDTGSEVVRVERGNELRYYHWNGAAWKEIPAADLGYPSTKIKAA
jgi:hypothetical protein